MRINHNIAALNAYRQLSQNQLNVSKHLEKLSSGLRINRASDDAAGLAISEKMRSQIRGLTQASRNALDAVSLIQTAEAALTAVHSMLQRMRELAVQSANDTNTADDRSAIQEEVNQLTSEINRIGNTTEFNTRKLLMGGEGAVTHNVTLEQAKLAGGSGVVTHQATVSGVDLGSDAVAASVTGGAAIEGTVMTAKDATATINIDGTDYTLDLSGWDGTGDKDALAAFLGTADDGSGNLLSTVATISHDGTNLTIASKNKDAAAREVTVTFAGVDAGDAATLTGIASASTDTGAAATKANATITFGGVPTEGATVRIGDQVIGFWDSASASFANEAAAKSGLGADFVLDLQSLSSEETVKNAIIGLNGAITDWDITDGGVGVVTVTAATAGAQTEQFAGVGSLATFNGDVAGNALSLSIEGAYAGYDVVFADGDGTNDGVAVSHTAVPPTITVTADLDGGATLADLQTLLANELGSNVTLGYAGAVADLDTNSVTLSGDVTTAAAATGSISFTKVPTEGATFTIGEKTVLAYNSSKEEHAGKTDAEIIAALAPELAAANVILFDIKNLEAEVKADPAADPAVVAAKVATAFVGLDAKIASVDLAVDGLDPAKVNITAAATGFAGNNIATSIGEDIPDGINMTMQIGANQGQSFVVNLQDMRAAVLGITGTGEGFSETNNVTDGTTDLAVEKALNFLTAKDAGNAITVLDKAISIVSAQRSKLGAFQNRLEHTIDNLATTTENLTAAESRVRDADMALEMTEFTKNNILNQAATAMLAQANQLPQGVLQLLGS